MLAESVLSNKALLARYLAGFDETNYCKQAPHLPNHVAWTLGHCALTMHRIANMFVTDPPSFAGEIPEADFIIGDGTRGEPTRFDAESVAFGSRPVEDPRLYPTLTRCAQIYDAACERLAATVRAASDEKLDQPVKWGVSGNDIPLWATAMRMVFHNGMHTGQLSDLRRALGFKSIFA